MTVLLLLVHKSLLFFVFDKNNLLFLADLIKNDYLCSANNKHNTLIFKIMELTSNDYRAISEKISEGSNYVEYSKGNETIAIECKLEIDGYEENGYDGTGAFVSTSKNLSIEKVESWNQNGDDTENDFNENELMSWVT